MIREIIKLNFLAPAMLARNVLQQTLSVRTLSDSGRLRLGVWFQHGSPFGIFRVEDGEFAHRGWNDVM